MNSTQLDSDSKPAANVYNDRFDRIEPSPKVPENARNIMNRVHRSLKGIGAINRILTAAWVENSNADVEPLSGFIVGGLMEGLQELADMAVDRIEMYADWANKSAEAAE